MYVDSMNDEGLDLERETWRFEEIWRERFYECGSYEQIRIWRFGERETWRDLESIYQTGLSECEIFCSSSIMRALL